MKCPHIIPLSYSFKKEFCSNVVFKARLMKWLGERHMPGWCAFQDGRFYGIGFVHLKDALLFKLTWMGMNNDPHEGQVL